MRNIEFKCYSLIERQKNLFFIVIITLLALTARFYGKDFISPDMKNFLQKWFEIMRAGGGESLKNQVGDYGLLYQTIIAVMTYFNVKSIYCYKILSSFFDFALALTSGYFAFEVCEEEQSRRIEAFVLVYSCVLLLPTVVINSAYWGQCDSIYSFFVLWHVWFLYKERYVLSAVMLGVSLAFKLQAVLLLPLTVYTCFYKKNFSLLGFALIVLLVFWLTGFAAYFHGRSFLAPFTIYFHQMGEYKKMWLNIHSFGVLGGKDYKTLQPFAVIITMAILGTGLFCILSRRLKIASWSDVMKAAVWIEWVCMLFLPAMHERYTYVLDLLLILLCFKETRYIYHAFINISLSVITYSAFLFGHKGVEKWYVLVYCLAWLHYTRSISLQERNTERKCENI